jgi:DNA polymerase-3 subunit beta
LVTKGTSLEITGTDLTTTIIATIDITPDVPGEVLLPGKLLGSLVAGATGPAAFELATSMNLVVAGVSSKLTPLDATQFPALYELEGETITLDAKLLADCFVAVAPAVSSDSNLGAQTGVFVEIEPTAITFTATDSYRLITVARPLDIDVRPISAAIPPAALQIVTKAPADNVTLTITDTEIAFVTQNLLVRTRLIAGTYPKWRDLLGIVGTLSLALPGPELLALLLRVAPNSNALRIVVVTIENGEITLDTKGDYGSSTGSCPVEDQDHAFSFSLQLDYFIAALEVISGPVLLTHSEANRPLLLTGSDLSPRCLLMPIRAT